MGARVAHEQHGERKSSNGIRHAEIDWRWPQPVAGGEIARRERRQTERKIACKLVETHSKAARLRADEIDLHDHRHRPCETLAHPQECVGGDDPAPIWRADDHEGNGKARDPAQYEHAFAAPCIGEMTRDQIGEGFDDAKAHDERHDQSGRCNAELLRTDQRHHCALDANHAANKGVDQNEKGELRPVLLEPQRDRSLVGWRLARHYLYSAATAAPALSARNSAACGGAGGMSVTMLRMNSASSSMRKALL